MEALMSFILYFLQAVILAKMFGYSKKIKSKSTRFLLFFFLLLIPSLLAAFRGTTGTDSIMYRTVYEQGADSVFRWQEFEAGFMLLISMLHKLYMPYQALFFTMSFLTTMFVYLWINMEKEYIHIEVAVFIYFMTLYLSSYNAMRQSLAVAMCLYAIAVFMRKRRILSVVIIMFATFFHGSALIALAIVLGRVLFENRHNKMLIIGIVFCALYLVSNRMLLGNIVKVLTGSGYYASYITRDAYTDGTLLGYYIKELPFLLITILNFKNYRKYPKMYVYFGLMLCGYVLGSLGAMTATQVGRISAYFKHLNIIVLGFCATQSMPIPKIDKRSIRIGRHTITGIIILYVLIYETYNILIRNFGELLPYQGIFR